MLASGLRVLCFVVGRVRWQEAAVRLHPREKDKRYLGVPFAFSVYSALDLSTWNGTVYLRDGSSTSGMDCPPQLNFSGTIS